MPERPVRVDYDFAQLLDLNCENCIRGTTDNKFQLRIIESRETALPEEKAVLDRIRSQCQDCFADGRQEVNSIQATTSCLWRGAP